MSGSLYAKENGYDMFGDDDDSSDNGQSSSEDEIDILLHGTPEQRRKLQHLHDKWKDGRRKGIKHNEESSSSEDEFEKAMDAELTSHVSYLENSRGNLGIQGSSASNPAKPDTERPTAKKADEEFYDEIYFDSDEEDENGTSQDTSAKSKHKIISNDDLLYDPGMDDRDQKWVDKQRQSHRDTSANKQAKKNNSDALLDCPACMTTLCIDCQRHETHKHQYRAMFVMNCEVDTTEMLECPEQPNKKKKKKGKKQATQQTEDSSGSTQNKDLFHPVRCVECSTVVGVYDSDEVYHFFNVLASHT